MINAKKEFLDHVGGRAVKCAVIDFDKPADLVSDPGPARKSSHVLAEGFDVRNLTNFLHDLNFVYENGFGTQFLEGTIWFTDGNWSDREEYAGSEWWEYRQCPEIPSDLRSSEPVRDCANCEYRRTPLSHMPCFSCTHVGGGDDNWTTVETIDEQVERKR